MSVVGVLGPRLRRLDEGFEGQQISLPTSNKDFEQSLPYDEECGKKERGTRRFLLSRVLRQHWLPTTLLTSVLIFLLVFKLSWELRFAQIPYISPNSSSLNIDETPGKPPELVHVLGGEASRSNEVKEALLERESSQNKEAPRAAEDEFRALLRRGEQWESNTAWEERMQRFLDAPSNTVDTASRQSAVKASFRWAWEGYRKYAWGEDELLPVSRKSQKWFGLGLTLIDSLDTMLLMGLEDDYKEARDWIAEHLDLDQDVTVNLFETTIRVLGGLLSAYHLSGQDPLFREKAVDLGERLLPAFDTTSGVPMSDVNLKTHKSTPPQWTTHSSLAETTTLTLEFTYLANITDRPEFAQPARKVISIVDQLHKQNGLAPIYISPEKGAFHGNMVTLGARGDSYYEYLLKAWLQSGRRDDQLRIMYTEALHGIRSRLFKRSAGNGLLYVAELDGGTVKDKMDHLVCFLPGLMALGVVHGSGREPAAATLASVVPDATEAQGHRSLVQVEGGEREGQNMADVAIGGAPDEMDVLADAEELTNTCNEMYRRMPSGLAPEITHFLRGTGSPTGAPGHVGLHASTDTQSDSDMMIKIRDSHNLLRPETAESLFVLWRVTRDPVYRDWGWEMWKNFERHCRISSGGYSSLGSVLHSHPENTYKDKQESFFLGETLKYLYLLFSNDDDLLPLDRYVLNTEAHPLPILEPPLPATKSLQQAGRVKATESRHKLPFGRLAQLRASRKFHPPVH